MKSANLCSPWILLIVLYAASCTETNESIFIDDQPKVLVETIQPNEDEGLLKILSDYGDISPNERKFNSGFGDISLDYAVKVTNPYRGLERYSLLMDSENNPFGFENLVLREIDGQTLPYITKFEPDLNWLMRLDGQFEISSFTGELSMMNLNRELLFEVSFVSGHGYNVRDHISSNPNGRVNCGGSSGTSGSSSGNSSSGSGTGSTGNSGNTGNTGGSTGSPSTGSGGGSCKWGTTLTGGLFIDCRELNMGLHFFKTSCDPGDYVDMNECLEGDCPEDPIGVLPRDPVNLAELARYMKAAEIWLLLQNDPMALIENCDQIEKWQSLAQHTPPQQIIDKIELLQQNNNNLFGDWDIQYLNEAGGAVVNMDYWPVKVNQMPKKSNGQRYTPDEFLEHFRKNINDFIQGHPFEPYCEIISMCMNERNLWNSNNPLGSIIKINIDGLLGTDIDGNDGVVICSGKQTNYWRFMTLEAPWDNSHPVSGTREFGYKINNDGSHTFYTRGVDRMHSSAQESIGTIITFITEMGDADPFAPADDFWSTLQDGLKDFVTQNGGSAIVLDVITERPDWEDVKEVLNGDKPTSEIGCE